MTGATRIKRSHLPNRPSSRTCLPTGSPLTRGTITDPAGYTTKPWRIASADPTDAAGSARSGSHPVYQPGVAICSHCGVIPAHICLHLHHLRIAPFHRLPSQREGVAPGNLLHQEVRGFWGSSKEVLVQTRYHFAREDTKNNPVCQQVSVASLRRFVDNSRRCYMYLR
jgi:hypothetical protein